MFNQLFESLQCEKISDDSSNDMTDRIECLGDAHEIVNCLALIINYCSVPKHMGAAGKDRSKGDHLILDLRRIHTQLKSVNEISEFEPNEKYYNLIKTIESINTGSMSPRLTDVVSGLNDRIQAINREITSLACVIEPLILDLLRVNKFGLAALGLYGLKAIAKKYSKLNEQNLIIKARSFFPNDNLSDNAKIEKLNEVIFKQCTYSECKENCTCEPFAKTYLINAKSEILQTGVHKNCLIPKCIHCGHERTLDTIFQNQPHFDQPSAFCLASIYEADEFGNFNQRRIADDLNVCEIYYKYDGY